MAIKPIIVNETDLLELPEKFQIAVKKELARNEYCKVFKVTKTIKYPYIDKEKEMIVYKAYIMEQNVAILVSQYGDNGLVSVDSMVIGDSMKFVEYWDNGRSLLDNR